MFAGWAKGDLPLKPVVAADVTHDGVRLQAVDFLSETAVELRLFVMSAAEAARPTEVILSVIGDEPEWDHWCRGLGPAFAERAAPRGQARSRCGAVRAEPRGDAVGRAGVRGGLPARRRADTMGRAGLDGRHPVSAAASPSSGRRSTASASGTCAGPSRPSAASTASTRRPLTLQGRGPAAGVALYAALFEPSVAALDLWNLPPTHRDGPIFLNVSRHLDMPQAVALALPRPVTLHVSAAADIKEWEWPRRLAAALGAGGSLRLKDAGE